MKMTRRQKISLMLALCVLSALTASGATNRFIGSNIFAQQTTPAPPADRALIYYADQTGTLAPFSFEAGTTPLKPDAPAKSNRISFVELKGERAVTTIANSHPRFYLFVPDTPNVHPPFLVRLATKGNARRAVVTTERGVRGFAYESGQIVKPHYRVLAHENGMFFMEVRARELLVPGEYAFIGADLARLATFRVEATSN
ncbi:MAG: hypothetical protein ABR577_17990 [Pyrinomonadaceae bacterium]